MSFCNVSDYFCPLERKKNVPFLTFDTYIYAAVDQIIDLNCHSRTMCNVSRALCSMVKECCCG